MATVLEPRLFLGGQVLAGEHDDRHVAKRGVGLHALEQLEAGHVRQPQVHDAAVERPLARARSASAPVPTATISMSSWPSSSTMLSRSMSLSSMTSSRFLCGARRS